MKVLVTDAEYKLTLGVIRSLGRRGVHVVAGSARRRAQGFLSRYCSERVVHPSPSDADRFAEFVVELAASRRIDVLLPVGYDSNIACSFHRERLAPHVRLPVADWAAMEIAASKRRTIELAREHDVPVPLTYDDAGEVARFPVVVKASAGGGRVRYVNDARALREAAGPDSVVQEYIAGEGRGFFALFEHGEERATFMHRRVREYPVTGGASTAAESIDDPVLRDLGLRLLRGLDWHGVAMVEFKLDSRDDRYKLMEINPKFWGSLDLAIAAGVDFPWLAVSLAAGAPLGPLPAYRTGLRFRWVWSDLMHSLARPRDLPAVVADLVDREVGSDFSWSDVKPNLFEGALTAVGAFRRMRDGTLRYPHGRPFEAVPGRRASGRPSA